MMENRGGEQCCGSIPVSHRDGFGSLFRTRLFTMRIRIRIFKCEFGHLPATLAYNFFLYGSRMSLHSHLFSWYGFGSVRFRIRYTDGDGVNKKLPLSLSSALTVLPGFLALGPPSLDSAFRLPGVFLSLRKKNTSDNTQRPNKLSTV